MNAHNNISFESLLDIIDNNGFNIVGTYTIHHITERRIRLSKDGFLFDLTRREWNSATGKHYVRFNIDLVGIPDGVAWKGSRNIYTRRDGTPRSFPYSTEMPSASLEKMIPFFLNAIKRYNR